jgi:hypothetical protein
MFYNLQGRHLWDLDVASKNQIHPIVTKLWDMIRDIKSSKGSKIFFGWLPSFAQAARKRWKTSTFPRDPSSDLGDWRCADLDFPFFSDREHLH